MQKDQPKAYILTKSNPNDIQKSSVFASKMICDMIKTCLGPRAMQKMVLTKINSVEMTNDGNNILRELDIGHPVAKCLIELSQTQDDECGDGTTSVIILTTELLEKMIKLLDNTHPIKICKQLNVIKKQILEFIESIVINKTNDSNEMLNIVKGSVSTKLCSIINVPIAEMALTAALKIKNPNEVIICDIKNNIKIEKIIGDFQQSMVVDGIIVEKEIIHPQMPKTLNNPKILMLDCNLEYKKGESIMNIEIDNTEDFTKILKHEEEQIKTTMECILKVNPNLVLCEKGVSDLAYSILAEHKITCLRRFKKTDMIRIAKATGSTIINCIDDIKPEHLGSCGIFECKKLGQVFYSFFTQCKSPKAISVIISGPTKDLCNELERNFTDAIKIAKNLITDSRILPGGGATEMAISVFCSQLTKNNLNCEVLKEVSEAFKIIPKILLINSGISNPLDNLNKLFINQLKTNNYKLGVNGISGNIEDVSNTINEPFIVKSQCYKSAFDSVIQFLRINGIIECITPTNNTEE